MHVNVRNWSPNFARRRASGKRRYGICRKQIDILSSETAGARNFHSVSIIDDAIFCSANPLYVYCRTEAKLHDARLQVKVLKSLQRQQVSCRIAGAVPTALWLSFQSDVPVLC